jgi:SAM-dependent methyltransferase
MLKNAEKAKKGIVLDVGTGQGTDVALLSRKVEQVVGIDISSRAIRVAKTLSQNEDNRSNISFVVGDAEHLPFKVEAFDIVFCKDVLHHVSSSMQAVLEMKRVARERGSIAAIEANALNPQMIMIGLMYFSIDKGVLKNTKRRLHALFVRAGLSDVHVTETEFLPRHMLFEYRSPINKVLRFDDFLILGILSKLETVWQKRAFLRVFSNYLLIVGFKTRKTASIRLGILEERT